MDNTRELEIEYFSYLIYTISILSSISFIICIMIIIIFIIKKNNRTLIFELIFYLAVSELISSYVKFTSIYKLYYDNSSDKRIDNIEKGLIDTRSPLCIMQRFLGIFSDFSTFFTILVISYSLNSIMIKFNEKVFHKMYLIRLIVFGIPIAISSSYGINSINKDFHL